MLIEFKNTHQLNGNLFNDWLLLNHEIYENEIGNIFYGKYNNKYPSFRYFHYFNIESLISNKINNCNSILKNAINNTFNYSKDVSITNSIRNFFIKDTKIFKDIYLKFTNDEIKGIKFRKNQENKDEEIIENLNSRNNNKDKIIKFFNTQLGKTIFSEDEINLFEKDNDFVIYNRIRINNSDTNNSNTISLFQDNSIGKEENNSMQIDNNNLNNSNFFNIGKNIKLGQKKFTYINKKRIMI